MRKTEETDKRVGERKKKGADRKRCGKRERDGEKGG